MPEPDRGTGIPASDEELDPVERLMVECLELPEAERGLAYEAACAAHPDLEPALRSRWGTLRSMGLLAFEPRTAVPERLGDFRLREQLGAGGMGIVYLAEQISLHRRVALKVLRPESLYFPHARERFQREAEAVARLKHPGIVPIYGVGEELGVPFLAMEFIEGATLAQVLEQLPGQRPDALEGRDLERAVLAGAADASVATGATPFTGSWVDAVVEVARQVAEALQHAHERGIVHRDVKPSNIVLTPSGQARLLDFGLAELSDVDRLTRTGSALGTLHYMAPEQLQGGTADARSDVYSLGATLYELLTLRPPHAGETRHQLEGSILAGRFESVRTRNRRAPVELDLVCAKALDVDPDRRYASARELAEDLANVLARRPVRARSPGPALLLRRWTQRHPAMTTAAVAAFLLVVVAPTMLLLREQEHSRTLGEALEDRTQALASERAARASEQAALSEAKAAFEYLEHLVFAASPVQSGGTDLAVADVLEAGVERIDQLADHPRLQVRMLTSLGLTLNALGRTSQAVHLLEQAREIERREGGLADTQPGELANSLANALANLGRLEEAREVAFEALAELESAGLGNSNDAGAALMTVGMTYLRDRDPVAAEEYLRAAVEVREAAPQRDTGAWIQASVMLANTLRARGRLAELLEELELLLEHAMRELPPTSPFLCDVLDCVAAARMEAGDVDGGLAASRRAVDLARTVHGESSNVVGVFLFNQSRMLQRAQRFEEALEAVGQAIVVLRSANGEDHPTTQTALRDQAALRRRLGR